MDAARFVKGCAVGDVEKEKEKEMYTTKVGNIPSLCLTFFFLEQGDSVRYTLSLHVLFLLIDLIENIACRREGRCARQLWFGTRAIMGNYVSVIPCI